MKAIDKEIISMLWPLLPSSTVFYETNATHYWWNSFNKYFPINLSIVPLISNNWIEFAIKQQWALISIIICQFLLIFPQKLRFIRSILLLNSYSIVFNSEPQIKMLKMMVVVRPEASEAEK